MTWTITYQYMNTATGPQWVAIGHYEPSPVLRQFSFGPNLDAHEARLTSVALGRFLR